VASVSYSARPKLRLALTQKSWTRPAQAQATDMHDSAASSSLPNCHCNSTLTSRCRAYTPMAMDRVAVDRRRPWGRPGRGPEGDTDTAVGIFAGDERSVPATACGGATGHCELAHGRNQASEGNLVPASSGPHRMASDSEQEQRCTMHSAAAVQHFG
jgi:hypothetical protein